MVRVNYHGVSNPEEAFQELKPFRDAVIRLQCKCRPLGSDYLILSAVTKALDTAAYHFTGNPEFYARRPPG